MVCDLGVSPIFPPSRTLCPASPSLQWVPWASVPHLPGSTAQHSNHRYYAPLRLPIALFGFLRSSLVTRYLASRKETMGSPKFPSYPFGYMPCSQTPVVSRTLALAYPGLLPSAR